jgi:hypothetical protein
VVDGALMVTAGIRRVTASTRAGLAPIPAVTGPVSRLRASALIRLSMTLLLPENHPCWWEPMHGRGRCCARWRLAEARALGNAVAW